ncbi:MAG: response regulator transcription factor [Myxococcota bacterium]
MRGEARVTEVGPILMLVSLPVPPDATRTLLTDAERDVARLATQGLSNRAIAEQRQCSASTVANQLARVYEKLGVSGRRALRTVWKDRPA